MLKSCSYCGRIHARGERCSKAPSIFKKESDQNRLRSTSRWTRKSLSIRERDHFLCRVCLSEGVITYQGIAVHHIIPLCEDESFAFEDEWLISLCERHHKKAEQGEIDRRKLHLIAAGCSPPTQLLEKSKGE